MRNIAYGKMNKDAKPNLYIIAGLNGSGKTTFAKEFLPNYADCFEFVNADLIASGLSPFKPESAAIKAGRLMLEQMNCWLKVGLILPLKPHCSEKLTCIFCGT